MEALSLPTGWSLDAQGEALRIRSAKPRAVPELVTSGWRLRVVEDDLVLADAGALDDVAAPAGFGTHAWSAQRVSDAYHVYVESFRERPGFPDWSQERWLSWATDYPSFRPDLSRVGYEEENPVAYLVAALEPDACWVVQMGVAPSQRRRGVGQAMLGRTWQAAQAASASALMLSVNTNNPAARALYERCGFRFHARRAAYERSGV